jgi:hypothetical protein
MQTTFFVDYSRSVLLNPVWNYFLRFTLLVPRRIRITLIEVSKEEGRLTKPAFCMRLAGRRHEPAVCLHAAKKRCKRAMV